MKYLALIPLVWLTGCLTTVSERMAADFIGYDSHYLIGKMGAPTKKEKDLNGEVWIYESVSVKQMPAVSVEEVTKKDKEGRPIRTETKTYPAYKRKTVRTKYFFFDATGLIYDTRYNREVTEE